MNPSWPSAALFGKGVIERRWSGNNSNGQAMVWTIYLRHTVHAVITEIRPRGSQHRPMYYLTILTQARVLTAAYLPTQPSVPHRNPDCCGITHCQSVQRSLAALVYAHRITSHVQKRERRRKLTQDSRLTDTTFTIVGALAER